MALETIIKPLMVDSSPPNLLATTPAEAAVGPTTQTKAPIKASL